MEYAPIAREHKAAWAALLAQAFNRTVEDMGGLFDWLQNGYQLIGWGAWDDGKLVAQYNCCMMAVELPDGQGTALVGMSINMAVDPAYRGRGLIKQVSQPVYEAVATCGGVAGVGFSNRQGVKVDLKSKSYGYQVVGQMQSVVIWLRHQNGDGLCLTDQWPTLPFAEVHPLGDRYIRFATSATALAHRFARHPFRKYQFGVWQERERVRGIVVYRYVIKAGLKGVALLAVYGAEPSELLMRWTAALQREGIRFVHVLTTPKALQRALLMRLGYAVVMPYSRSPYYLTVKPFAQTPLTFLDFSTWDCLGGDIL